MAGLYTVKTYKGYQSGLACGIIIWAFAFNWINMQLKFQPKTFWRGLLVIRLYVVPCFTFHVLAPKQSKSVGGAEQG